MTSEKDVAPAESSKAVGKPKKFMLGGLNSFFSSKPSHMSGFRIALDKSPLHRYRPGDTVKGSVILDVQRPMGVTHLTICLWGYVHVFRHHSRAGRPVPRENTRASTGRGRRWSSEYWGDGFASLFEEEVVLCGEGRLDPGPYHFQFELEFPNNMKLPTSIEFERGTVTYLVSATITRPIGIQPTTKDEKKVLFQEIIDIANFAIPKPLTARLDRIERGSKLKRLTSYHSEKTRQPSWPSNASKTDHSSRTLGSEAAKDDTKPPSPVAPSEHSHSSNGKLGSSILSDNLSSLTSHWHRTDGDTNRGPITATMELGKPGGIAGGTVPVFISVQHTKAIRSASGIIVTLFRQSRVDMHPNLPLGPSDNKDKVYEDLYPKSKSGLGGLSLSAAGSSQNWRREVSQTFGPLVISEDTMSTDVKVLIRIPEDVLPSIECAPGDMINFKYSVEVMIDIQGKLSHQERSFPTFNLIDNHQSYGYGPTAAPHDDGNQQMVTLYYGNCIDTAPMIRSKALNLIVHTFDFVIGTTDTTKPSLAKGKGRAVDNVMTRQPTLTAARWRASQQHSTNTNGNYANNYYQDHDGAYHEDYYNQDPYYDPQYYDYYYDPNYPYYNDGYDPNYHYDDSAPYEQHPYPPPNMEADEGLSEKERQRRWEESHLPSQPPQLGEDEVTPQDAATPSAPFLPPEGHLDTNQANLPTNGGPSTRRMYQPNDAQQPINDLSIGPSSYANQDIPAYSQGSGDAQHTNGIEAKPTDDKQELERRRMQAQASAPESGAETSASGSQVQPAEETATAPIVAEDDDFLLQSAPSEEHSGAESLPEYQR